MLCSHKCRIIIFFISILIHSQEQDVLTFLNETSDTFKDFALLVRRKLEIFIFLMILTIPLAVLQAASRGPWL